MENEGGIVLGIETWKLGYEKGLRRQIILAISGQGIRITTNNLGGHKMGNSNGKFDLGNLNGN